MPLTDLLKQPYSSLSKRSPKVPKVEQPRISSAPSRLQTLKKRSLTLRYRPQTWAPSRTRRATKAALALRHLIVEPPSLDSTTPAVNHHSSPSSNSTVPRLREKDVERLRTQLLKPTEAAMVIREARVLTVKSKEGGEPMRAVCLDCDEAMADTLIHEAKKIERTRVAEGKKMVEHRFATIKTAPAAPPRLPVLLSLVEPLQVTTSRAVNNSDVTVNDPDMLLPLGLFMPASAMSLHRPLAGALPSADTLRRGFDALLNAESKIYMYEGPSHRGIYPPTDRLSIYTYWWGFELAMPPATLAYLGRAKIISISLLNLLSVIVYAVPGGTRELAPFVGVLSRFIETEWMTLKSQDQGQGVVCGATWFIPAAIVARPWDFGDEAEQTSSDLRLRKQLHASHA